MRMTLLSTLAVPLVGLCSAAAMTLPASAEQAAIQPAAETVNEANFAVVQRHVDAYRSGDLDRFVATFARDAVVRADGYVAIGHDQIRALYQLNFEPGAPRIKIHDSYQQDGIVVLHAGYVMEDGQEWCCSVSEYEISDGKVSFLRTGS